MKLLPYHSDLISNEQLASYSLSTEQLSFSDLPKDAIQQAKQDSDRYPVFLTKNAELLSFFILHTNEGPSIYTDYPQAILLRSFSTNQRYQGKGYAKSSLLLLPQYIQQYFPDIHEIILGVNAKNNAAIQLYEKTGFIDNNHPISTEYGELRIMTQRV